MTDTSLPKGFTHNATAHDGVAALYDGKHTEIYNDLEQARLGRLVEEIVALSDSAAPRMLDVGAGTGNLGLKFLARGCHVCAADVSEKSLRVLAGKAGSSAQISTVLLAAETLPVPDASFDIVGTYSVLHHVPDYLLTVREMARVLRTGGLLYIDHEASEGYWRPNAALEEYRRATRLTPWRHAYDLLRTGEAFTYAFAKTAYMKAFVDRRYEREGDIHVWPDDHISWERIGDVLRGCGMEIVRSSDYLLYQPRGGLDLYRAYEGRCSDTRYLIARKR